MGIILEKHDRSAAYVGRFDPNNEQDMKEYDMVKQIVKVCNSNTNNMKFRVEKKGRKPTKGFTRFGSPIGGIENATLWDVYIWRRYTEQYHSGYAL